MGFGRPRKLETEGELYEYAVGALGRRMRSVAELKRLLRQRVEIETEIGQTLVELVVRRLKDQGYLSDAKYAAAYSAFRRDNGLPEQRIRRGIRTCRHMSQIEGEGLNGQGRSVARTHGRAVAHPGEVINGHDSGPVRARHVSRQLRDRKLRCNQIADICKRSRYSRHRSTPAVR